MASVDDLWLCDFGEPYPGEPASRRPALVLGPPEAFGPGFPFVILPLMFKYHTLRYRFDDEGVSMSWGLFFRREVYLTYRRVQDIHVTRNLVERWMGLAKVLIQTASGTSGATMAIVGIRDPEPLRDFLYQRMRGARGLDEEPVSGRPADEALVLLREIRDALRESQQGDP